MNGYAVRLITKTLIFMLVFASFYGQEQEQTKQFELENGLKVFCYERHNLPLINIVFAVNVGSKDESEKTNGLIHILEHYILFRGTGSRSGFQVGQDIREHGAYFNAHTGRDLAIFELTVPLEHIDFALENQKEILFNLKLSQKELEKEKQVILEEIDQLHDDPLKYATSLVLQNLFNNHPYCKPIHGNKEIIKSATVEQIEQVYKDYFIPSNCALTLVGDFSIPQIEQKIKDVFGDLQQKEFSPPKLKKISPLNNKIEVEKEMDVNQAYLVIGLLGPDYNHPDQYEIDLLTEILGRGVNPMLNYPFLGPRELIHSVSMNYAAYKYGGAILIFFTLDPKNIQFVKNKAIQFLKNTRKLDYSKDDYLGEERLHALDFLKSAQNQLKFKFNLSQEDSLNMGVSSARFLLLNENPQRENYIEKIKEISSTDLRSAASKYLGKNQYVAVSILPLKK